MGGGAIHASGRRPIRNKSAKLDPLRLRVCQGLAREVVEIGFGSGLNVSFYPAVIARVSAIEPSDVSWKPAGERLKATNVPVRRSGLDGRSLPFADDSFDGALFLDAVHHP